MDEYMEEMVALDFLSFDEEEEKCLEFLVEELLDLTELTDHESPEAVNEEERIPTGVTCDSEHTLKESIDGSSMIYFPVNALFRRNRNWFFFLPKIYEFLQDEDTVVELEWASRICDDSSTAAAGNEDGAFEPVKVKRRKRRGDGKLWFLSAPPRIDSPVSSLATSVSDPRSCGGKEKISSVFCFPDVCTIPTSIWASKICDDCSAIATENNDEDSANAPVKAKRRTRRGYGNHWSLSTPPPHESSPTSPSHTSHVADSCDAKEHKVRRCTHCSAQRTPQWREGPLGSKTLCNACGVRYKSGRLLPEYRPACSPTFVRSKHSNCHREVLEMRRKKLVEKPLSISTPWVFAC